MNTTERGGTDRERKSCGKPRSSAIISLHQHPSAFVRCRRWSSLVISGHPHTEIYSPYKGGPEGLTAIIKGDVDFFFIPLPAARGLIAAGNVAAIAVSGSKRASALPDVPTTVEAGFPNSDYNFWVGMFAPVATPKAIVERLHAETTKALKEPAVVEKLAKIGGDPQPMQPADFDSFVRKEIEVNAALVKAARLQVN